MLTIQYLPNHKIEALSSRERVNLILDILKSGKIILIDGRLKSVDEAALIRETMSVIDDKFNGVEIGVMYDHKDMNFFSRLKHHIAKALVGDRGGITFIGPAKIISELRQHPENVEISFQKEYLLNQSKKDGKSFSEKIVEATKPKFVELYKNKKSK